MSDTAEIILMLGTVISMLSTMSNTLSRYDRIMKRIERAQIATEDAKDEENEMLEAVRAWQEDCAREDYETEMMNKKTKKRKAKKERDPERPKRGKCAFIIWSSANRARVRSQLEAERAEGDTSRITAGTVSKRLGAIWKEMCDEDKSEYQEQAQEEMERYRSEMLIYNAQHCEPTEKIQPSAEAEVPVKLPEGWTGPFYGYLEKLPKDPVTGKVIRKTFDTMDQAFAEAKRIGTSCSGITMFTDEEGKQRITLRKTTKLNSRWVSVKNEVSYIAPH